MSNPKLDGGGGDVPRWCTCDHNNCGRGLDEHCVHRADCELVRGVKAPSAAVKAAYHTAIVERFRALRETFIPVNRALEEVAIALSSLSVAPVQDGGQDELREMLRLRKELDPDAPDVILMSAAPTTDSIRAAAEEVNRYYNQLVGFNIRVKGSDEVAEIISRHCAPTGGRE